MDREVGESVAVQMKSLPRMKRVIEKTTSQIISLITGLQGLCLKFRSEAHVFIFPLNLLLPQLISHSYLELFLFFSEFLEMAFRLFSFFLLIICPLLAEGAFANTAEVDVELCTAILT